MTFDIIDNDLGGLLQTRYTFYMDESAVLRLQYYAVESRPSKRHGWVVEGDRKWSAFSIGNKMPKPQVPPKVLEGAVAAVASRITYVTERPC